jgi:hypothetical protein
MILHGTLVVGEAKAEAPERLEMGLHPTLFKAISLLLLLLVSGFLLLASTRRLNFDEALALRSGWLLLQDVPGSPSFYMPTTLLLGSLGSLVSDPGTVFLVARLVASVSVCLALFWFLRVRREPATALVAGVLIFSQATFVVHGLEFRYDWAILIGLLVAHRLLVRARPFDFFWLGVCVSWLAAHHLKGVYFAAVLYLLATVSSAMARNDRLRRIRLLNSGLVLAVTAWVLLTALLGYWSDFVSVYSTFFSLAVGTEQRFWPWTALAGTLRRDAVWWLGAAAAAIFTVAQLGRIRRRLIREQSFWNLMFALAPMGFLFLHPHPWAYMLVLPVPFLSLLMANLLTPRFQRATAISLLGGIVLVLLLQFAAARNSPWSAYLSSLAAPRSRQVATLRQLRELANPEDKIIDPSGLAYFLKPCTAEWYLDALFEGRAAKGMWMQEMKQVDLEECPWMLNTYRLSGLPKECLARVKGTYVLYEQGGGLALLEGDPRLQTVESWHPLPYTELLPFL